MSRQNIKQGFINKSVANQHRQFVCFRTTYSLRINQRFLIILYALLILILINCHCNVKPSFIILQKPVLNSSALIIGPSTYQSNAGHVCEALWTKRAEAFQENYKYISLKVNGIYKAPQTCPAETVIKINAHHCQDSIIWNSSRNKIISAYRTELCEKDGAMLAKFHTLTALSWLTHFINRCYCLWGSVATREMII